MIVRKAVVVYHVFQQTVYYSSISPFAIRICLSEGRGNPIIHYSLLSYVHGWMIYKFKM